MKSRLQSSFHKLSLGIIIFLMVRNYQLDIHIESSFKNQVFRLIIFPLLIYFDEISIEQLKESPLIFG